MGWMSLVERLDADLGEPDTDKRIPNETRRCQSMIVNVRKIGPRSERHLECLVTVCAHSGLIRVQGKLSLHMVVEVEQQDLEISRRRVWCTRKRLSDREKIEFNGRLIRKYSTIEDLLFSSKNIIAVEDEAIQWHFQDVVRCTSRIQSIIGRWWKR